MRNIAMFAAAGALAALATGCFTVHHCDYPEVQMSHAPAEKRVVVQISGFEANITSYLPVYGYETVWRHSPGYYRHGRYHCGAVYPQTYSTTSYIPQTNPTTAYAERAQDTLEDAGFVVGVTNADYRVEVKFAGPMVDDGDRTAEVLWLLLSALSADYGAETWTAKLRIYDAKTGDMLMHHDYAEKYTAAVWGPIPIFSPAGSDQTSHSVMQNWCLSALTDRVMADATAFMSASGAAKAGEEPEKK
ncbi:MAG: hypothetical protein IJI73_07900 [Kiritimatiellae bacterium]|nr:hypothetical protein [Kiritimatiellia bacterium]